MDPVTVILCSAKAFFSLETVLSMITILGMIIIVRLSGLLSQGYSTLNLYAADILVSEYNNKTSYYFKQEYFQDISSVYEKLLRFFIA